MIPQMVLKNAAGDARVVGPALNHGAVVHLGGHEGDLAHRGEGVISGPDINVLF